MTTTDNDEFDVLYGSRYLAVPDLKGETPRRKIGKVEVAELKQKDGSTKKKYVLFLEKEDKALVLNTTNAKKLAEAFGKDRKAWPDNWIELFSVETNFGPGLRLRPMRKPATPTQPDRDMDDFIPFN
jgi:hypothetical protein